MKRSFWTKIPKIFYVVVAQGLAQKIIYVYKVMVQGHKTIYEVMGIYEVMVQGLASLDYPAQPDSQPTVEPRGSFYG